MHNLRKLNLVIPEAEREINITLLISEENRNDTYLCNKINHPKYNNHVEVKRESPTLDVTPTSKENQKCKQNNTITHTTHIMYTHKQLKNKT